MGNHETETELDTLALRYIEQDQEIERLKKEVDEYAQITGALTYLLTTIANVLKGDPGPLIFHDWSDLPKVAQMYVDQAGIEYD